MRMLLVERFQELENNNVEDVSNLFAIRGRFYFTTPSIYIDDRLAECLKGLLEKLTHVSCYIPTTYHRL